MSVGAPGPEPLGCAGSAVPTGELRVEVDRGSLDHCTLRVYGTLSMQTAPVLGNAVLRAVTGRSRVVLDVSQLDLAEEAAILVLPSVLADAGGWPWAKLALAGPTPALQVAVDRHIAGLISCYGTTAQAAARLDDRPARVRRKRAFEPVVTAERGVRDFLAETSQAWGASGDLIEIARMATSELAANAIEHARTPFTVTVELRDDALHVRVRDRCTAPPIHRPPDLRSARGRGIPMVAALSTSWGVHTHPHGKTVWFCLTPSRHHGAREKRTIRARREANPRPGRWPNP